MTTESNESGDFSKLFILYGDNGSGKTTILRLVFNLLLSVYRSGKKTEVAQTPFEKIEIEFNNKERVIAERSKGVLTGSFTAKLISPGRKSRNFDFVADEEDIILKSKNPNVERYHRAIQNLGIAVHFLPDDRRIQSSLFEELEIGEEVYLVEAETRRLHRTRYDTGREPESQPFLDVQSTADQVSEWIRDKTIQAAGIGEVNTNTIYLNLINRLARRRTTRERKRGEREKAKVIHVLENLAQRSDAFTKYGFSSHFPADKIVKVLLAADASSLPTILEILIPFTESVQARFDALGEIESLVSKLISMLDSFFIDKKVRFNLREGLSVIDETGSEIDLEKLSSGEKQLLLMLCSVRLSRDTPSIFIIDEPEISLNVKWQRRLLDTLLKFTEGANIQFILATHSMELLTKHRKNVVQLIRKK